MIAAASTAMASTFILPSRRSAGLEGKEIVDRRLQAEAEEAVQEVKAKVSRRERAREEKEVTRK